MPIFSWDRFGAKIDTVDVTASPDIAQPEHGQIVAIPQHTATPIEGKRHVSTSPVQGAPAKIPQWLLWERFDAKLDKYNKVVSAREAALRKAGSNEATICRMRGYGEKKTATATVGDRLKRSSTLKDTNKESGEMKHGTKDVLSEIVECGQRESEPEEKTYTTANMMRDGIERIKTGGMMSRSSLYWQSREQECLDGLRVVEA
jgi:nitrogen regulatory protein PII